MTSKLQKMVKKTLLVKKNEKEENLVIGQIALFGLKVLCRILGNKQEKDFIKVNKSSLFVKQKGRINILNCFVKILYLVKVILL